MVEASQRRGFHRLGLLLAAVLFIVGAVLSFVVASDYASQARRSHDEQVSLMCAQTALKSGTVKSVYANLPPEYLDVTEPVDLAKLGCSTSLFWKPTVTEVWAAKPPSDFSYTTNLLPGLLIRLVITLAVSLLVYGVTRAVSWVIGGFAAS